MIALRPRVLRWESMAMALVATAALAIWPAVAHAARPNGVRATPRQAIINGHCVLVDAHGVPLTDSLYWQRTGHDPC